MIGPFAESSPVFEYQVSGTGRTPETLDLSQAENGSCDYSYNLINPDALLFSNLPNAMAIDIDFAIGKAKDYQMTFEMTSGIYPDILTSSFDFTVRLRQCMIEDLILPTWPDPSLTYEFIYGIGLELVFTGATS